MKQEMTGWQWHQLDHMQIICSLLQTDNHGSTSPLSFYRLDALPAAQLTASKHWRSMKMHRNTQKIRTLVLWQLFNLESSPNQIANPHLFAHCMFNNLDIIILRWNFFWITGTILVDALGEIKMTHTGLSMNPEPWPLGYTCLKNLVPGIPRQDIQTHVHHFKH